MSIASTPVPKDHPVMVAWERFKLTAEYADMKKWAGFAEHVDGALWGAFLRGYGVSAFIHPQTDAMRDIIAERRRQIEQEGWSAEHDDKHGDGSLALAAACYAMFDVPMPSHRRLTPTITFDDIKAFWPWEMEWWKPRAHRRNMVKAVALGLAEIERMDRGVAALNNKLDEADRG